MKMIWRGLENEYIHHKISMMYIRIKGIILQIRQRLVKEAKIMKAPIPTQDKIKDVKAAATIKKAPSLMPISLTPLEMESLIESNINDGNEVKVPLTPNKPIVTVALWIMRFLFEFYRHDFRIGMAYNSLPSFYIKQMWFQGCLSGILYSGGNFMCIISVTFLGQGVGYSFTQCSMLISLWGIYCFKEIEGRDRILKFPTCLLCLLSLESLV